MCTRGEDHRSYTPLGKVYLAGPISGLSYEEARYGWRSEILGMIDGDIDVLSPMRQEGHLKEVGTIDDTTHGEYDHYRP